MKKLLINLYGINSSIIQRLVLSIIYRIDGDETTSITLRKLFKKYYDIEIGMYTMGGVFTPYNFDRHTIIGRYCSIARTSVAFNRNHPIEFKSTHGYFFNTNFNYCKVDPVKYTPLVIGNDVWLGHNCIIMPNVKSIGDGAVVAAGAVINKDVPPYAIVVGNPGRVVKFRFSPETIAKLLESKWWEKSIEEIKKNLNEYTQPYENYLRQE